jgi:hypothetical protein
MDAQKRADLLKPLQSGNRSTGQKSKALCLIVDLFDETSTQDFERDLNAQNISSIRLRERCVNDLSPHDLIALSWTLYDWLVYNTECGFDAEITAPPLLLGISDFVRA